MHLDKGSHAHADVSGQRRRLCEDWGKLRADRLMRKTADCRDPGVLPRSAADPATNWRRCSTLYPGSEAIMALHLAEIGKTIFQVCCSDIKPKSLFCC